MRLFGLLNYFVIFFFFVQFAVCYIVFGRLSNFLEGEFEKKETKKKTYRKKKTKKKRTERGFAQIYSEREGIK